MARRKVKKIKQPTRKKRFPIFRYIFLLLFLVGAGFGLFYLWNHPVLINPSKSNVSLGSNYNPEDAISFVFFGKKEDVKIDTDVDANTLGEYKTKYTFKDYSITVPVKVLDNTPPVLKLKEYTTDKKEKVTPECFITDIKDVSEVTTKIKSERRRMDGTYKVTIVAEDAYGNKTTEAATLIRKNDKEAPKIEFLTEKGIYNEGEETDYLDGIKVTDNFDKKPTITTNADTVVNGAGEFVITYTVTDRSGNKTTADFPIVINEIPEEEQRIVYLTFDDGPSANTARVLDILAQYNVKATFFVTGAGQNYNDLIKREYAEGHTVGLHTYTHDYAIYTNEETYINDLQAVSDMVYDLIGVRSNIIRFPGGSSNTISANYNVGIMSRLVNLVTENGYYYFDWNVSSSDASGNNVDVEQIKAYSTSGDAYDHIVLLMHDTDAKDTTVEALPYIIEHYRDQGYIFKGLSYRSPECHHGVNN